MLENKKFKKGIVLYLVLVILSLLFIIGIGLYLLISFPMKMARELGYSKNAAGAADSGIERALYGLYKEGWSIGSSASSSFEGAFYQVQIFPTSSCPYGNFRFYCIISKGQYKGIIRNIQAAY